MVRLIMSEETQILVMGGGISGITSALEAAEAGYQVTIIEKSPYLGGKVALFNKYFPKLCPPPCGLEINFRRIKENPRIKYHILSEVESIAGEAGNYTVTVKKNPSFINEKCVACDDCVKACPVEVPNHINSGLDMRKAVYMPYQHAFPFRYTIEESTCKKTECNKCVEACNYGAIDLTVKEEKVQIKTKAVIVATGWEAYDPSKMTNLGFDTSPDIISNVTMERIASANGPTKGKMVRPSDGRPVKKVAFVQCAGSRDENHLHFCSGICCLATLKQISYVRDAYPDSEAYMFYIDIRTPGTTYERFLNTITDDENVHLVKGKVAKVETDEATKDLIVTVEDIQNNKKITLNVDLCVLATGMEPNVSQANLPSSIQINELGFVVPDENMRGIIPVGNTKNSADVSQSVQSATAASLQAIQVVGRL